MKKLITALAFMSVAFAGTVSAEEARPLTIRYVDFKKCIETSKMGLAEKEQFEAMKKKMETALEEKQKELNALASKLNDPDYLDSLSPEAETDLKRKGRALSQELAEMENQSYQILNQTNFKVVQKLTEAVSQASKSVAKRNKIDVILNEESCFFESADLDITDMIVDEMNTTMTEDKKDS